MAKLIETGEKDRLKGTLLIFSKDLKSHMIFIVIHRNFKKKKEMLHDRLVSSGWRDELKEHCKAIIRRKGLEKVTVEELVAEITPKGRCESVLI